MNVKTCVRLLLVFIIALSALLINVPSSHAITLEMAVEVAQGDDTESSSEKACTPFKDEAADKKMATYRDDYASLDEEYTLDIIELILNLFEINTLEQLVFGNPFCIWFDDEGQADTDLNFGLFPSSIKTEAIDPMFSLFVSISILALCLSMMISGLKMGYSYIGDSRFNIGEEIFMYFITALLLVSYWLGVDYVFMINNAIVTSLGDLLEAQGIKTTSFSVVATADSFTFSDIIILLAEWIIVMFLNVVYLLRLFMITILLMVGGLAIVGLLFESTRKYFKMWLLDFLGAVFMQSVHSLYFAVVILFVNMDTLNFLFKLTLLILFLPLSSMLLGFLNLSSSLITQKSAQNMVKSGAKLVAAKRFLNSRKANTPTMEGQTAISALATGSNSGKWDALKRGAGFSGAVVGGMAGLVLGGEGATLGSSLGAKFATSSLQVPRNITAGVKGIMDTRGKVKDQSLNLNNISDKRQYYGSMGESIGAVFGKGSMGRNIGYGLSGVSKSRLMNSTELGGLGDVSLSNILLHNPEAKIQFQQTNEGSGFYLNDNGQMKPISPIGEADAKLPFGAVRTIDFDSVRPDVQGTSHLQSLPNTNQLFYQSSPAVLRDANGNSFADQGFDSSKWTPEQHCNFGEYPSPISPLNSERPQ